MLEFPLWGGHNLYDPDPDKRTFQASEEVLRHRTFQNLIEEKLSGYEERKFRHFTPTLSENAEGVMDKLNFGDPDFRSDEIDYLGFRIDIVRKKMLDMNTLSEGINFNIYDQNGNAIFRLLSHFTHVQRIVAEKESPKDDPLEIAGEKGLERVKAIILLGTYPDKGEILYKPLTSKETTLSDVSDEEIQMCLLDSLFTVRKNNPESFKSERFPIDGFCEEIDISQTQFLFIAGLSGEKGLIGGDIESGKIWITGEGISAVKKKKKSKKISGGKKLYGKWEIIEPSKLRGGQAKIYKIKLETGKEGALKEIVPKTQKKISRFQKEIESLTRLEHKYIVPVLEHNLGEMSSDSIPEKLYYVMPWASKGNLNDLNDYFRSVIELSLKVFRKICEGVSYAHSKGVIHRDLKPENILFLDSPQEPKVADFGICFIKDYEEEDRDTETNERVGSRFFIAPEQELGINLEVDERADIFSLGKLLLFMLTEKTFEANWIPLLNDFFTEEDQRFNLIEDLVRNYMIVEDKNKRYISVEEVIAHVDNILAVSKGNASAVIKSTSESLFSNLRESKQKEKLTLDILKHERELLIEFLGKPLENFKILHNVGNTYDEEGRRKLAKSVTEWITVNRAHFSDPEIRGTFAGLQNFAGSMILDDGLRLLQRLEGYEKASKLIEELETYRKNLDEMLGIRN
jgi:serine/threonine protein kinase